jgi:biopolymer transport protein ExbD
VSVTIEIQEASTGMNLIMVDSELQADFHGDSKEQQCVIEVDSREMQTSNEVGEKGVQVTDFELSINKWVLNQPNYQLALKQDSLMLVDQYIKMLQHAIEDGEEADQVENMNKHCQIFINDITNIKSKFAKEIREGEAQTTNSNIFTFDKETDGSVSY